MTTDRRSFLSMAAAVGVSIGSVAHAGERDAANDRRDGKPDGPRRLVPRELIESPTLPYAQDALAPHISAETVSYHYGKHHVGYYNKLVELLSGQQGKYDLPSLIVTTHREAAATGATRDVYNAAAQLWNHNFYWKGLKPNPTGTPQMPSGALRAAIERHFGGHAKLIERIQKDATAFFGSGWVWLVADDGGKLKLVSTENADTPFTSGLKPLWVIDVWEHSYYVDQRNKKAAYVTAVLQNLINWDFVAANYART